MMQPLRLAVAQAYARLFGPDRLSALAEGWRKMRHDPEVIRDLLTLGHVFEPDIDPATGRLFDGPELIARAARKSMALTLLAQAEITHEELNHIRQGDFDDAPPPDDDDA